MLALTLGLPVAQQRQCGGGATGLGVGAMASVVVGAPLWRQQDRKAMGSDWPCGNALGYVVHHMLTPASVSTLFHRSEDPDTSVILNEMQRRTTDQVAFGLFLRLLLDKDEDSSLETPGQFGCVRNNGGTLKAKHRGTECLSSSFPALPVLYWGVTSQPQWGKGGRVAPQLYAFEPLSLPFVLVAFAALGFNDTRSSPSLPPSQLCAPVLVPAVRAWLLLLAPRGTCWRGGCKSRGRLQTHAG
ncbi:unnamed protein product [Pleuronectes platessa]|uniref:Uncharacterized protein n=1 Tax=Pleuronectes platessa TaxID=8262 RepID=A0A9N7YTI7_PLEPL|nr:unnamed protein product [Pleuronectes platessa]